MTMMMVVQLRRSQRLKSLKLVDRVLCDLQHMLHSTRMRSVSAWAKATLSGKTANQISVGMTTHPCAKLKSALRLTHEHNLIILQKSFQWMIRPSAHREHRDNTVVSMRKRQYRLVRLQEIASSPAELELTYNFQPTRCGPVGAAEPRTVVLKTTLARHSLTLPRERK